MKKYLSSDEIDAVIAILNKFQTRPKEFSVSSCALQDLYALCSRYEQLVIQKLCNIQTGGTDSEHAANQLLIPATDDYAKEFVRVQKTVFEAFEKMNLAMKQAVGQQLSIVSGYRSPAYQVLIFLRELYNADFDIVQAERVAKLPSRSEHGYFPFHAIDVAVKQDRADKKEISTDFEKSSAYSWMIIYAGTFGFTLSYPQNNQKDTIFEPWHWLYA